MRTPGWSIGMALLLSLGLSGCATIPPMAELEAAGVGFAFSGGKGTQTFPSSPSGVAIALNQAMEDLDLKSIEMKRNGSVIRVESVTTDDRPVVVTLRHYRETTFASVRIGWFGDEPLSRALLQRTAVRLGSHPPEAIPETAPSAPARNPFFSRSAVSDAEIYRDLAESPYRDRVIP